MAINNYSISDIVNRIQLTLPSKFSRDNTSNTYKLFSGLAQSLQLQTDMIDELWRQTNINSATGQYVDMYISELYGLGRLNYTPTGYIAETDNQYKTRANRMMFVYNCTKDGLKQIVLDLNNNVAPKNMYVGTKRGAYLNSKYYYDNGSKSTWGTNAEGYYTGYIEFSRKPNKYWLSLLCKQISACKAEGIQIYIKYPILNDLVTDFSQGTIERSTIS